MARVVAASVPALVAIGLVSACQRGIVISPAPIHEVNVSFAEAYPAQVFVSVKGGLPDGCTTFHDLVVERKSDVITITVTNERPRKAVCPAIYGYFEKSVALGSNFTPGKTYTLKVNDFTTTFIYPL